MTTMGTESLEALRTSVQGTVLRPGDDGFAEATFLWNAMIDRSPAVVVQPRDTADVVAAVGHARASGMPLSVRGGGHNIAGTALADGGVTLDMSLLRAVEVDPVRRLATVQAGCRLGDVDRATQAHGLATPLGFVSEVGVAGLTLGGGLGYLTRRFGWAVDNLVEVELVTADGRVRRASAIEEPELFWAMRGAGHNFGATVALELELIELEEVSFGFVWFHPERTTEALEFFREWIPGAPDELTTIVSVGHPPRQWGGPDELSGQGAVHVIACHCGEAAAAERDLAPLRDHPAAVTDDVRRMPWSELAVGNDVFASGVHRRSRMHYLRDLTDEVIAISDRRARELAPLSFMSTHYYGGALRRVDEDATAMSHRDKPWNYMVSTTWAPIEDGEPLRRWQDDYLAEIAHHAEDAYYVNYLFDEPDHVGAAYNPRTWERLRALKRAWDPRNLFAANQNVPPA